MDESSIQMPREPVESVPTLSSPTLHIQPKATVKPIPRKLPNHPIDLHMPLVVYFPEDDDKAIRALREYEYGGPLPAYATLDMNKSDSYGSTQPIKKDIPLPGVNINPDYEQETTPGFSLPLTGFLKHTPPICFENNYHFEKFRIEYEVDDKDEEWLAESRISESEFDEEAMEILMDVLEKESFRQLEFRQINAQLEETDGDFTEDDVPCTVCGERDWGTDNQILLCDGCNMPIHQACQDLDEVPEGDWFCDACAYRRSCKRTFTSRNGATKTEETIQIVCALCGMVDGGPFKRTQQNGKLVHIVCALMSPEVWFEGNYANITQALKARKNGTCQICHFPGGVVKCSQRQCNLHYHPLCARENGQKLSFFVPDPSEDDHQDDEILDSVSSNCSISEQPFGADDSFTTNDDDVDIMSVDILSNRALGTPAGDSPLNTSTSTINSTTTGKRIPSNGTNKKRKKKRKTVVQKKTTPHLPFQLLCAAHTGVVRATKLEDARKASLSIPVEVGRFLREEDQLSEGSKATGDSTFSCASEIIRRLHSKKIILQRPIFDKVVEYWRTKRLSNKLGHMPFIYQLHVLVSHFKEDFDAGRKVASRPRQVEITLAQYSPQQKFEILSQLRDRVESLRTLMDLIKKRELKKRQAIIERLHLFDAIVEGNFPKRVLGGGSPLFSLKFPPINSPILSSNNDSILSTITARAAASKAQQLSGAPPPKKKKAAAEPMPPLLIRLKLPPIESNQTRKVIAATFECFNNPSHLNASGTVLAGIVPVVSGAQQIPQSFGIPESNLRDQQYSTIMDSSGILFKEESRFLQRQHSQIGTMPANPTDAAVTGIVAISE